MATEQEFRDALLARSDVEHISDSFMLGKDEDRQAINAGVRRRVLVYRIDKTGEHREFPLDYGVLPDGQVYTEGAGSATKEPSNPEADVFRQQAEDWLAANAQDIDPNIRAWWITGVDEQRVMARVMTLYATADSFTEKPFIAIKAQGEPVEFKPVI